VHHDGESGVVHIDGGRVRTLRTQLVALPPVLTAPGANPSPSPHDDSKNMRRRRWLWSLAGVMVVAGAAAVTAVLLTDSHPTETRAVPGPNTPSGAAVSTWVGL